MAIRISIVAGPDNNASSVNASGTEQHVITDDERATFKLGDAGLKNAVNAYFGKSPNDAFLHGPTPWGDLYKVYSWPPVQLVLVVQSAQILSVTSQPVIVKTQEFDNSSSQQGTFNVAISELVNNTVSSNWSTGGTLTIGEKFTYEATFLGTGVKGEDSISYSQSWGVGGQQSQSITIGSTSGVSVPLGPGQGVVAELSASRGVLKVRIQYTAYLIGTTAVNYNPRYKEHHFWSLDIGSVMSAAGIPNSITSTEDIDINYYSDSKIELKDKQTKAVTQSFRLADVPGH